MRAYPTTTVTIYRGTASDAYGDVTDTDTPVAIDVLASIIETEQTVFDRASSTPRIVRRITGRFGQGTDVRVTDRLHDDRTGRVYSIDNVVSPRNGAFDEDVRVALELVSETVP